MLGPYGDEEAIGILHQRGSFRLEIYDDVNDVAGHGCCSQLRPEFRPHECRVTRPDQGQQLRYDVELDQVQDRAAPATRGEQATLDPALPRRLRTPGQVADHGFWQSSDVRTVGHNHSIVKEKFNSDKTLGAIRVAEQRRLALRQGRELLSEARRLLVATPSSCDAFVCFSAEAECVAAAAAAHAASVRRELVVLRASHLRPADPAPVESWTYVCAEELLGWCERRAWAVRWAAERGGVLASSGATSSSARVA